MGWQVILKWEDGRSISSIILDDKPSEDDDIIVEGMALYQADSYEIVRVRHWDKNLHLLRGEVND